MKHYKQALLSVFVIFAAAYILTIMGCQKSTDISNSAAPAAPSPQGDLNGPGTGDENSPPELHPINPADLRECTKDEFSDLVSWSNDLGAANDAIRTSAGQTNSATTQLALKAIRQCDELEFYHTQKPCKKTTRVVTDPDHPTTRGYDAYSIHQRCQAVDQYLRNARQRPERNQGRPAPYEPQQPNTSNPVPVTPPPSAPTTPSSLSQCTSDEFAKLNTWRAALDSANKNISRLGAPNAWKYDAAAVQVSGSAVSLCESLIAYHDARPCQREKTYTGQSLREQCASVRQYYYNYAQRTDSLIVQNARLYLNTSIFGTQAFNPGPSAVGHGQCVISNTSPSVIAYQQGQKALVTEARVYTDPENQMFVLVTQEGLKMECYGVNYPSTATSLSEVIRLLAAKQTPMPLSYELN